jgi:hypothetical protein
LVKDGVAEGAKGSLGWTYASRAPDFNRSLATERWTAMGERNGTNGACLNGHGQSIDWQRL